MKYYIIAGEASGDLHGSNLMKELKKQDSTAQFRFWGGDLMAEVGGTLVKHYRELAFMGFVEVVMNIRTILSNISFCKKDIIAWKPDKVIFIDYPGFNLKIAPFVKKRGFETIYYISPQVWAWKSGRINKIKKCIDQMLVILPFEKEFYARWDYKVEFVGHPLMDAFEQKEFMPKEFFLKKYDLNSNPIIALLPGSRKQEIIKKFPLMLAMKEFFPDYQFIIAGAPGQDLDFYKSLAADTKVINNDTYNLLHNAHAALVTSGTATLETALMNVPEVVCYKGNLISYEIGKRLIKNINYISLVNLILEKEVVKELIQTNFTIENLQKELAKILEPQHREKIKKEYQSLWEKLGGKGASAKAAKLIANAKS